MTTTHDMKQLVLPLWSEIERTAPASVVRSSLFGVVKRGSRRFVDREVIASWGKDSITFTGKQLDQADFDLWLEILHQGRENPGEPVYFNFRGILKAIGRSTGGTNVKWLRQSLTRLKANEVLIKSGGKEYAGSLIHEYAQNSLTDEYYLVVNKRIGQLFNPAYAKMLLDTRLTLKTDMSRWLYAFISSQKPRRLHTIGIKKLQTLSGSSSSLREFRRKLKRDMPALMKEKAINYWTLREDDVLEYRRVASLSEGAV